MKFLRGWIVPALAVAVASGCGGPRTEIPEDAPARPASHGSTVAPVADSPRKAAIEEPKSDFLGDARQRAVQSEAAPPAGHFEMMRKK